MSFPLVGNLSSKQWWNRKKDSEQVGMTREWIRRILDKPASGGRARMTGLTIAYEIY